MFGVVFRDLTIGTQQPNLMANVQCSRRLLTGCRRLLTSRKKGGEEVLSKSMKLIIRVTIKDICAYITTPISRQEIDQTPKYGESADIGGLWLIGIEPCMYITQSNCTWSVMLVGTEDRDGLWGFSSWDMVVEYAMVDEIE